MKLSYRSHYQLLTVKDQHCPHDRETCRNSNHMSVKMQNGIMVLRLSIYLSIYLL